MLSPSIPLYFIRHGQTDWNAERRLQGSSDTELNDTGRQQAERHGRTMAAMNVDWEDYDFVVSPLSRTRETLAIIAEHLDRPVEPRLEPRLIEGAFGRWEGKTWTDIIAVEPENHALFLEKTWTEKPHGGESYGDIAVRLGEWLATVDRPTVVVSHGGVSRVLRVLYLDLEKRNLMQLSTPQDKFLLFHNRAVETI